MTQHLDRAAGTGATTANEAGTASPDHDPVDRAAWR
jgi:hypothetical protein